MPIPNNWTRGILDLAIDNDGFLWAASGYNGLYKFEGERIIRNYNNRNSSLKFNYTVNIEKSYDGILWIVHGAGVQKL